jgi:two-component system nitrate/nitrite sensor histidine kinase NarX
MNEGEGRRVVTLPRRSVEAAHGPELLMRSAPMAGAEGEAGGYKPEALNILSEVAASLATDADIEGMLQRFLGTMIRLAGATAGAVRVLTADGTHLRLIGSLGLPPDAVELENLVSLDCSHCGSAMQRDHVLRAVDVKVCAEHTGLSFFRDDCRAMVVVPLQFRGRILGVYNLYLRERQDIPQELALLLRTISEHLGMALENARLERENLRIAMMNERQMMANEVHDSLAQTLAYMKMRLSLMQDSIDDGDTERACKLAMDVKSALDDAYAGLRELLTQFRKRMDPLGLLHALESLADEFRSRTGITIEYCNHITDLRLSVDQEVQVFYIIQEALANVTRHSGATLVKLTLEQREGSYEVTVDDNGSGFFAVGNRLGSFEEHPGLRQHLGLSIMRERAQRLRGRVETANLASGGARVRLVFPVPRKAGRAP